MKLSMLTVAEYSTLTDDIDCTETILLDGKWPISVGRHPDFAGPILTVHIQDRAVIVTLDPTPDPDPAEIERLLTPAPQVLQ